MKSTVKKTAVKKVVGNKLSAKIESEIKSAKKNGAKELVVLTTKRSNYNKTIGQEGFGASDLKKTYKDLYKELLIKHDVFTRPVNVREFEIAWIVKFK